MQVAPSLADDLICDLVNDALEAIEILADAEVGEPLQLADAEISKLCYLLVLMKSILAINVCKHCAWLTRDNRLYSGQIRQRSRGLQLTGRC